MLSRRCLGGVQQLGCCCKAACQAERMLPTWDAHLHLCRCFLQELSRCLDEGGRTCDVNSLAKGLSLSQSWQCNHVMASLLS